MILQLFGFFSSELVGDLAEERRPVDSQSDSASSSDLDRHTTLASNFPLMHLAWKQFWYNFFRQRSSCLRPTIVFTAASKVSFVGFIKIVKLLLNIQQSRRLESPPDFSLGLKLLVVVMS